MPAIVRDGSFYHLRVSATTADRPWLIDARSGTVATYRDLLTELQSRSLSQEGLVQPASTREALLAVTHALVRGAELTLFDSDLGSPEIASLGFTSDQINQAVAKSALGEVTLDNVSSSAAGATRTRIGLFTSGSTGLPKLVRQSVSNLSRAVKVSPIHRQAVWALAYNPTHVAGIQVYLQALANLCPIVDVYGLDRASILAALARHGVTHLSATPSFYRLLLPPEQPLTGVRSITMGGESSDAGLIERMRAMFPQARVHNIYASTEAGTLLVAEGDVFAIAEELEDKVRIFSGHIMVHRSLLGDFSSGGSVPEEVQKAEMGGRRTSTDRSAVAVDWYDTGDVVEVVSESPLRFRIVARERDWVNIGGSKVNPAEVEALLGSHPGVRQARVYGRKNSVMGNVLMAEVVRAKPFEKLSVICGANQKERKSDDRGGGRPESGEPSEAALRQWLEARLQAYKVPRYVRFVDKLSTTRTGKLLRT